MEFGVALLTFVSDSHVFPLHKLKSLLDDVDKGKYAGVWLLEQLIEQPAYQSSYLDPPRASRRSLERMQASSSGKYPYSPHAESGGAG